jgi:glyoxylate reductase
MIGQEQLARMKKTAFLINTARGTVVDERALAVALRAGQIAGAGLDVFANEPEVEPLLLELPNVVLLPHVASASVATRTKMCTMAAESILAVLANERPRNLVNPEALGNDG